MADEPTLKDRVSQFNTMQLPGQPFGMHMGTSYLVNDLDREVDRLRAENKALREALVKVSRALDKEISAHRCTCPHPCDDYFVHPGPCGAREAESYRNIKTIADAALASQQDGGTK